MLYIYNLLDLIRPLFPQDISEDLPDKPRGLSWTPPPRCWPPSAESLCTLSVHPHPWGSSWGWGISYSDKTLRPRRKHGWQMSHNISYQVSAWKIYKVTRQWEAGKKTSSNRTKKTSFQTQYNALQLQQSQQKNTSPFNPLSFLIHATQI